MLKCMCCPGCGGRSDDHATAFIVSSLPNLMAANFSLLNYYGTITLDYEMTVLTKLNSKLKSIHPSRNRVNIFDTILYSE